MKPEIVQLYYDQRTQLLKSILMILVISSYTQINSFNAVFHEISKKLTKGIPKMISLLSKTCEKGISKDLSPKEKQEFLYQKCREEELTLQILFCLLSDFNNESEDVEKTNLALLKYFKENSFEGVFFLNGGIDMTSNYYQKVFAKLKTIRDLSAFTSMLCMSVNTSTPKISESLVSCLKETFIIKKGTLENLLKTTGYIVAKAALKIAKKEDSKVAELRGVDFESALQDIKESSVVETIVDLLDSEVMRSSDYEFLKGPLQNVVKQWITKAYYVGLVGELNDREKIGPIIKEILSEKYPLNEFWKSDYSVDRKSPFFELIMEL